MSEPRRGGRLPDPGMGAICGRCSEPREAHGGPRHLGACPGESGIYAKRFSIEPGDRPNPEWEEPPERLPLPRTVTDVDELITWLRPQLDDDERVARTAAKLQFDPENGWGINGEHTVTPHIGHIHEDEARRHIIRWNPARVLAEIHAKRRILDLHQPRPEGDCDACNERQYGEPCPTVRLLALPYADRDGYREEWRPQ